MSDIDALLAKYGAAKPAPPPPPASVVAKPVQPITPFPPIVATPKKKPSLAARFGAWFNSPLIK